jgi:hypothetical protein
VLRGFGLVEHSSSAYPPRTAANVRDSDGTVLFGNVGSPGCTLTRELCDKYGKPSLVNPTAEELRDWVRAKRITVLNCAGNRERTNPGLARRVAALIAAAFAVEL